MELNLGFNSILALFVAMSVLAAVPSVSVLAVSAKSASFGFVHGACTVAGIVLGDIFFILFVVFGLALLVEAMG
ncbi:MAG TPA: LysE family transporter, partial [Nitrosomonas halophila]|nr:LysE family transporter [Nitrosomonas halophila]